jgi:uncharacterized protein (TIGR01777 family)
MAREGYVMRVLVTGGTGFLGQKFVKALEMRGDEAWIVSRRPAPGSPRTLAWDGVETHVKHMDAIVHLAGEGIADARWSHARFERIRASRVDTGATIARAVARAERKPKVLVSGSAIGVYGLHAGSDRPVAETHPAGGDALARLCVAWESAADPARTSGVRVVHPRIGVVLGATGGMLKKLLPIFRRGLGGPIGSGTQCVSWVHERDVVRALLFALDRDNVDGPLNVVAPEPVSMNDFARTLGDVLRRPAFVRVPAVALRAVLGAGLAEVLLTGPRVAPEKLRGYGFEFTFARLESALRDLVA